MKEVWRHVIRRVRYATNTLALVETRLPPEGRFDSAITNGLMVIVSTNWPGEEKAQRGDHLRSARELRKIIEDKDDASLYFVSVEVLREGLDLTQPFRHGRAIDEFATITRRHVEALRALDRHRGLVFLEKARGRSVDDAMVVAFGEQVQEYLPFDLKNRPEVPAPAECPHCWRPTFLPTGWEVFGSTRGPGGLCIACGYERSHGEAFDDMIGNEIEWGAWD